MRRIYLAPPFVLPRTPVTRRRAGQSMTPTAAAQASETLRVHQLSDALVGLRPSSKQSPRMESMVDRLLTATQTASLPDALARLFQITNPAHRFSKFLV